jgi:hypothetical protein
MNKIKVNFIITCFDKENYWPYLKEIIKGYKNIESNICLAYNGVDENFECDVRIPNRGHQLGEFDLIRSGYEFLKEKHPEVQFFIKLAVDTWPLNEEFLLRVHDLMTNRHKVGYGGNFWNTKNQLSTDIFFANVAEGNIFDFFKIEEQNNETQEILDGKIIVENLMYRAVAAIGGNFYLIREREPVHPNNRDNCHRLCLVMSHDINENIRYLEYFKKEYPLSQIKHCYNVLCAKDSDINKHLPTIKALVDECETVCEVGSRGVATWAVLAGEPDSVVSYVESITDQARSHLSDAAKTAGINLEIFSGSEMITDRSYDMLFVDAIHNELSLRHVLDSLKDQIKKYIVIHNETIKKLDGWVLKSQVSENNGLTIFQKERIKK